MIVIKNARHIYINKKLYLKLGKNFILPFRCNGTCISESIVYIILCKRCNYYYIGESSKTVNTRIRQHLNDIRRFSANLDVSLAKG